MDIHTTTSQWSLKGANGFQDLHYEDSVPIPTLGDHDCLIQIAAASLNYRDIVIARGQYPPGATLPVVPVSDAAGTILAVGPRVRDFKAGDRVCPTPIPRHLSGKMDLDKQRSTLGGHFDGLLRNYAVLGEETLALIPDNLTLVEASTLPTAALTAWNALYGGTERIKPGDVVLTQGTGGVSLFAAQFALAAGATIIATTSSKSRSKTEVLKRLGVHHIIDYTLDPTWGVTARSMTPGGNGVDFVIDIGGAATLEQSLQALRYEGSLVVVGFLSGMSDGLGPGLLSTLTRAVTVRGILGGTKLQFEDMNRAVKGQGIKPVVDEKLFSFTEVREAYQYLADQHHVGKVVIRFQ